MLPYLEQPTTQFKPFYLKPKQVYYYYREVLTWGILVFVNTFFEKYFYCFNIKIMQRARVSLYIKIFDLRIIYVVTKIFSLHFFTNIRLRPPAKSLIIVFKEGEQPGLAENILRCSLKIWTLL